jgi:hypothetical protein
MRLVSNITVCREPSDEMDCGAPYTKYTHVRLRMLRLDCAIPRGHCPGQHSLVDEGLPTRRPIASRARYTDGACADAVKRNPTQIGTDLDRDEVRADEAVVRDAEAMIPFGWYRAQWQPWLYR